MMELGFSSKVSSEAEGCAMEAKEDLGAKLRKLFPQVDHRIIRATVLEHKNDIHGAIRFIMDEVLEEPEGQHTTTEPERESQHIPTEPEAESPTSESTQDGRLLKESGLTSDFHNFNSEMPSDCGSGILEAVELPQPEIFDAYIPEAVYADLEAGQDSVAHKDEAECSISDQVTVADASESAAFEDHGLWKSSSSSYVGSEMIEQTIEQTKTDKQTLINSIQALSELRHKAQEAETAAQEAKSQALHGGEALHAKAAEVKEKIVRIKEANAMRAGEVYGEKAILRTEEKELFGRLQQVRTDWSKAFNVIEETKAALRKQIDTANEQARIANEERLHKEAGPRKILEIEEELLAKVLQESEELAAEAEACAKLRELRVQQGSVLDSLQGEIAVLYEDAEHLKSFLQDPSVCGPHSFDSFYNYIMTNKVHSPRSSIRSDWAEKDKSASSSFASQDEDKLSGGWDFLEHPTNSEGYKQPYQAAV